MRQRTRERVAWSLVAGLTAFWLWFGLASALEEDLPAANLALHLTVPGGLFAVIAAIAWRWRLAGGLLLVIAGALVMAIYPLVDGEFFPTSTLIFVLLTMAAPPITAGVLLIATRRGAEH